MVEECNILFFRDAIIVCLMDLLTGFAGGFVIFSVLGHVAHESGINIENFNQSGSFC
jgi:hypothetical protein